MSYHKLAEVIGKKKQAREAAEKFAPKNPTAINLIQAGAKFIRNTSGDENNTFCGSYWELDGKTIETPDRPHREDANALQRAMPNQYKHSKVLSLDVECNGLWGQPFAVAAVVFENSVKTNSISLRCPIEGDVNPWVAENVIPQLEALPVNCDNLQDMLAKFATWYLANKQDATIIAHMGAPVETNFIRLMQDGGHIGDWDAPYPLHDVATLLLAKGYKPDTVDGYLSDKGIAVDFDGTTHHPMYDALAAAAVWIDLL